MLRSMSSLSCFFTLLIFASFAVAQVEFSADLVQTERSSKVYFGKDKVRIEPVTAHGNMAWISDLSTHTFTMLMNKWHKYSSSPPSTESERGPYSLMRTEDVENACDWLTQAWSGGGTCHKVGSDTVNGRATVKYEGTDAKCESTTIWLDTKLHFPVKWHGKDWDGELQNIQEGAQPSSLFEIPAGYTKLDEAAMQERQKQ